MVDVVVVHDLEEEKEEEVSEAQDEEEGRRRRDSFTSSSGSEEGGGERVCRICSDDLTHEDFASGVATKLGCQCKARCPIRPHLTTIFLEL